ncbi:uncharacterized protein CC84DRAFT_1178611 [Paraphaeosphaeria sporulosa]|uniref:Uncharacterized protein n=1 Tax=Paraphaeosphaeria sporulosa TaxID=1460663 RepID=A0A177C898_9PLEO|nr:uncharacterized protein CC84DRAFT_1178611 [Paraphaeosphaeria sporulosa]OAG03079.1 hypothetical protein CC84DRAFT_1178611 [Paraphaeosphaeria sporulosa]
MNNFDETGCLNAWGPNSEAEVAVVKSVSPNEKVQNPGLFECANGDHTCNENGNLRNVSKYYKALVLYNSGVLAESGNQGDGRATACYASNLASRLMGWTGIGRTCDPDTIGDYDGTPAELRPTGGDSC